MADQMDQILDQRRQIRARERAFRRNPTIGDNMGLREQLKSILPPNMLPGNVGDVNKVTWPYWYSVTFNFGTNPVYGPNTRQVQSFQVSQEAAILLMAVSRKSSSISGGDRNKQTNSPLAIEIRDRQSSRQFNNIPIPMQNIGSRYRPTILPTPMLIQPNAFVDVTMNSWAPTDATYQGSGVHEFQFFGYRMRIADMGQVYSTIFG